jgi:hypothetical protein
VLAHRFSQPGHLPPVVNVFHTWPQPPGPHLHLSVRAERHLHNGHRMPQLSSSGSSMTNGRVAVRQNETQYQWQHQAVDEHSIPSNRVDQVVATVDQPTVAWNSIGRQPRCPRDAALPLQSVLRRCDRRGHAG